MSQEEEKAAAMTESFTRLLAEPDTIALLSARLQAASASSTSYIAQDQPLANYVRFLNEVAPSGEPERVKAFQRFLCGITLPGAAAAICDVRDYHVAIAKEYNSSAIADACIKEPTLFYDHQPLSATSATIMAWVGNYKSVHAPPRAPKNRQSRGRDRRQPPAAAAAPAGPSTPVNPQSSQGTSMTPAAKNRSSSRSTKQRPGS
jgi:hypothetical protein